MTDHEFSLEGAPNRLFIIVCSCGYRSEPTHLSNNEATRQRHLADVGQEAS